MELSILKNFVSKNVEVLVAGVWIEGFLGAIEKGVATLLPIGEAKEFYGPTALKVDVIQAIRQVKHLPSVPVAVPAVPTDITPPIQSTMQSGIRRTRPGGK